jgi:hypothetical protein
MMSRSGDCGKRPRWPCEPLAGGSGPGHDRGDGPTSGPPDPGVLRRRQHAWADAGLSTARPRVGVTNLVEVGLPKLKELTDTWSGAGQPDIIAQWGKMRLVRYLARGPRRHPVPVLIVSPLLAKPYVLDLAPGLSLVDHLVERGSELFLLDFGIPDRRDRQLRFEDHLGVVDLAMNELLAQTGAKRATLLGYCLGGIFATVYAATHPDSVQNWLHWRPRSTSPGPARFTDMSAHWMLMAWSTDSATSPASGSETRFGRSRR